MLARLLLLLGVLSLAATSLGQGPNEQVLTPTPSRNGLVKLGMRRLSDQWPAGGPSVAVAPGSKASGTKVELDFFVSVEGTNVPDGPTTWNRAEVTSFKVNSVGATPALAHEEAFYPHTDPPGGGEAEGLTPGPDPASPQAPPPARLFVNGGRHIRIASTEFPDDGTIGFVLSATVRFWRWNGNGQPDTLEHTQTFSLTPSLTACNEVLLLATNEEWNGTAYVTNPTLPTQPLYKNAAAAAMPLVRPHWGIVHHTIIPDAGKETKWGENAAAGDTVWRTQNLDAEMNKPPAFFGFTHGENTSPPHIRASVGPSAVSDGQMHAAGKNFLNSEVYKHAYTGRTIPDYQFVVLYACSVGTGSEMPVAFNIDDANFYRPWRGLAGFPRIVFYKLSKLTPTSPDETLDQHAEQFMEYLSQGVPMQIALNKMQVDPPLSSRLMPEDNLGMQMKMSANGSYARLRYVYLEPDTYQQAYAANPASVTTWFWLP